MASWTAPVTHASGEVLAVTDWNGVANDCTFLYEAPYAHAYDSAGTSIPSGTPTPVNLGTLAYSGYGFSLSSNYLVFPLTGIYWTSFSAGTASGGGSSADSWVAELYLDGTEVADGATVPSYADYPRSGGSLALSASASDSVRLYVVQFSGSTLTTTGSAAVTYVSSFFVGSQ